MGLQSIMIVVGGLTFVASGANNINGEYGIANAPNMNISLNQRAKGKYFDVYTPVIQSLYSQVQWSTHYVDFPADVVAAYDGKVMNIVGYEFDIIRKVGGGACNTSSSDHPIPCDYKSVPTWEQYNHHYNNNIYGKATKLVKTGIPNTDPMSTHIGHIEGYASVTDPILAAESTAPSFQFLPMGNGAESRKTLKYFPPGYGALLASPQRTAINPMIIDTKNRNASNDGGVPGRHGYVPKESNVGPEAMYSGIMECPCTDAFPKKFARASMKESGACGADSVATAAECFEVAVSLGLTPVKSNMSVSSSTLPLGCTVTAVTGGFEVSFNSNSKSAAGCGSPSPTQRTISMMETPFNVSFDVDLQPKPLPAAPSLLGVYIIAGPDIPNYLVKITLSSNNVVTATCEANPAFNQPQSKCFPTQTGSRQGNQLIMFPKVPGTISTNNNSIVFTNGVIFNRIGGASSGSATITATGPASDWFGVGFTSSTTSTGGGGGGAGAMNNAYAIICDGTGAVTERKLGNHEPGSALAPSIKVTSNTVANGVRTVVLSRPMAGLTSDHFSFDSTSTSIGYLSAVGTSPTLAYHKEKISGTMYFVDVGAPSCLCSGGAGGTIGTGTFRSDCGPRPLGQLLSDPQWANTTTAYTDNGGVNPTCELKSYKGGLKCCGGGTIITDTAEARAALVAEADYDEYQVLYRYYYEDGTTLYNNNPITDTYWTFWWTEYNNGEHDIPPCYNDECIATITSNFTGANLPQASKTTGSELIHVEGHCHIGCQKMELWNMDDPAAPVLLCRTKVDYGKGDLAQDEMGYILGNQPCVFGNVSDGFQAPPVIMPDTKLMSIKFQNNTHPRYGDMALWEMRASYM